MALIDKSALVAEIEKRVTEGEKVVKEIPSSAIMGLIQAYKNTLSIIDTLEVREVDLDFQRFAKEMDAIFALPSSETKNTEEEPLNWEYAIAKHFYLLGLEQKGE